MAEAGIESEVQKLRREKDLLTLEVVQLRQEHLMTVHKMAALNQRMQSAEVRQKQMVSFLAKPLQNPVFLSHLKQLKEQREIGSMGVRRKFLKQQQPASSGASNESMDHQIMKYRSGFWDTPASSLLPDIETGGQEFFGGSLESEDLKGKDLLNSQIDASCPGRDYIITLPDDIIPDGMVSEDISPAGLSVSRPDSTIFAFKGKDIVDLEADAAGTEFLKTLPEDIDQERVFPDAIVPATDCVSEERMWNIGPHAGRRSFSFGHTVWDTLGHYHAQEMEAEAGSCALGDLGLHTLEEDLDIDKYVGGESSLQEPKDVDRQIEDCPTMMMEP